MKRVAPNEVCEVVLLDRRIAYSGESWSGYLLRLAEANLINGIRGLAALCGMTIQQAIAARPSDFLPRIGVAAPSSAPVDAESQREVRQRHVPATSGRTVMSRVCPCCFRDDVDPFIRAGWDDPLNLDCKLHRVLLLDSCQACGQRIDMLRVKLSCCQCGSNYKDQSAKHTPGWIEELAQLFPEARSNQVAELFQPATQLGQQAARICHWLVARSPLNPNDLGKRIVIREPFLDMRTAEGMQGLLADWPHKMADSVVSEVDATSWKGYSRLSRRLGTPAFSRLRDVIAELKRRVPRHVNPGSAQNMRKLQIDAKPSFGIKDLMEVTGHSHGTLLRCIDDGGIPGATYSVDPKTGQRRFEIPKDVFLSIKKAYVATNDIESSALLAGCSGNAMRGLVRAGCVQGKRLLTTRGGDWCDRVDPGELAGFARALFNLASQRECESKGRIYFSAWVPGRYSVARARRWRRLFTAIVQGKLKVHKATEPPIALNDLYVMQDELDAAMRSSSVAAR